MNSPNTCPCCSEQLLRHARQGRIYWFCSHCWQEMPNLASAISVQGLPQQPIKATNDLYSLV